MAGDSSGTGGTGLLDSLRQLAATFVAIVQTRLEILSTEIEEEKLRLGRQLLLAAVALFFLGLGAALLTLFVVLLFWDSHRVAVTGFLALAFLVIGTVIAMIFRSRARAKTALFAASLSELAKDHEQLTRRS